MRILAIIPARGGSKGIKNKNIVDIHGKPLIEYSIKSALKLKSLGLVSKVIVSTDSERIAKISRGLGVEIPFLRPKRISGDKARSADVILHAITYFKKNNICFDAVLTLQPTTPLRSIEDVKGAIELFQHKKENSLISCYREKSINGLMIYGKKNNRAVAYHRKHNRGIRRQECQDVYVRNGAVYLTKVAYIKKYRTVVSSKPLLFEMPKERSINIDTKNDLRYLRSLLCE